MLIKRWSNHGNPGWSEVDHLRFGHLYRSPIRHPPRAERGLAFANLAPHVVAVAGTYAYGTRDDRPLTLAVASTHFTLHPVAVRVRKALAAGL